MKEMHIIGFQCGLHTVTAAVTSHSHFGEIILIRFEIESNLIL